MHISCICTGIAAKYASGKAANWIWVSSKSFGKVCMLIIQNYQHNVNPVTLYEPCVIDAVYTVGTLIMCHLKRISNLPIWYIIRN